MSKKRIIFMSISILGMLLVLMGTSYAFFMYSKTGEKQNELVTGIFQVTFQEESGSIYLKNAYPMKDEEGQNLESFNFSVENKGDITAKYQISIVEDESNTLNRSSLRYELKKQGDEGIISNLDDLVIRDNVTLDGGQKDTYELRIWLDEATGNEAMSKTWKGKVQVIAEESKAYAFEDYIAPTIKLNGERVMTIKKGEEFTDPGIESVSDNVDNLLTNDVTKRYEYFNGESTSVVDGVNTNREGVYVIYYELLDSRGNKGVAARAINVVQVNSNPPVVTLNGESEVNLYVDESYEDKGASARDELGESLPVLVFGSYNTESFGDYIINYFAIDKDGNIGSNTRTIHVKVYEDPVGANRPELTDGLIPVYYDEDNQVWRKANKYGKWYSYGEQWWGNAVTLDQSIVRDVSGKNNYATYDQGTIADGDTITLDGVNDFIDLGLENFEFGKTFSMIVRFKINSYPTSSFGTIIGNQESAGMHLGIRSDAKFIYSVHDGTSYKTKYSTQTFELNTWYEVAMVFNGSSLKIFLDGTQIDSNNFTSSFDMAPSTAQFSLGANPNPNPRGLYDSFANITYSKAQIYKQVLTEQQVKDLYNGKELSDKSNLLAELNLKDSKFNSNGRIGNTITTDGIDDYINLGLAKENFGQTFSAVVRFKVENYSSYISFILGNAESAGMDLMISTDKKIMYEIHDGTRYYSKTVDKIINLNQWYEIALTFNGSSFKLYLDGELLDSNDFSASFNMSISSAPFNLGANPDTNDNHNYFENATYSKAQIYKQTLTEQEVKAIYDGNEISDKKNLLVDLDFGVGDSIDIDTPLPMESINTMWTWIPRYEYNYENIKDYAGGTQAEPGAIGVRFLKNTSASNGGNYMLHPAFTFGNEELKGFWYGKFETSNRENTCIPSTQGDVNKNCDLTVFTPQIKPNVTSWRGIRIATAFTVSQKMSNEYKNEYGFSGTEDTHMSKNSEWGAVAYLSQSTYGKWGNDAYKGSDKEVYINNCSKNITGIAGKTPDASSDSVCENTYEKDAGQKASTTGNIYGVYDMNGGANEYVMGILADNDGNPRSGYTTSYNSGFNGKLQNDSSYSLGIVFPNEKYYDLYFDVVSNKACNSGICYGHALSETSGWYNDYAGFASATNPWIGRGGNYESASLDGLFYIGRSYSGGALANTSFRLVLVP